jgi:hypothetical protein
VSKAPSEFNGSTCEATQEGERFPVAIGVREPGHTKSRGGNEACNLEIDQLRHGSLLAAQRIWRPAARHGQATVAGHPKLRFETLPEGDWNALCHVGWSALLGSACGWTHAAGPSALGYLLTTDAAGRGVVIGSACR